MTLHPSRRQFLGSALCLAAAPALLRSEDKGATKKDDPFGGFTLGCQSYTFREFDREQCLKRIKDLDLHYVEFYQKHAPLNATPAQCGPSPASRGAGRSVSSPATSRWASQPLLTPAGCGRGTRPSALIADSKSVWAWVCLPPSHPSHGSCGDWTSPFP